MDHLTEAFKAQKLTVSTKTVVVASVPSAAKAVQDRLLAHGITAGVAYRSRDLGFDAAAGKRRATAVLVKRLKKATKRVGKLRVISRINLKAKALWRTNIWPTAKFSIGGMGLAPTSVDKMRSSCSSVALNKAGSCRRWQWPWLFVQGPTPQLVCQTSWCQNG